MFSLTKILICVHSVSSPVSPPSDSTEVDTPRMSHSCWAPCFSVSLAPTPTHRKDPPGVTRTNASLEFRLDAAASSCMNTDAVDSYSIRAACAPKHCTCFHFLSLRFFFILGSHQNFKWTTEALTHRQQDGVFKTNPKQTSDSDKIRK